MYKGVDRLEYRTESESAELVTVISFEDDKISVKRENGAIKLSIAGKEYSFNEKELRG